MLYTYRFFSMPTDASGSSNSISSAKYCRSNILINYLTKSSHVLKDFQIEGYPKRKHNHFFYYIRTIFNKGKQKKADKIPRSHQLFLQSYDFNKYDGIAPIQLVHNIPSFEIRTLIFAITSFRGMILRMMSRKIMPSNLFEPPHKKLLL